MPDVSIAISAQDNYSGVLLKIKNSQTAFRKDVQELSKELDRFNKTKVNLKVDLAAAKKELQDAQREFKKTNDAAKLEGVRKAQENYDRIKDNLNAVSKAAKNTQKDLDDLAKSEGRRGNRGSGGTSGSGLSALGKSGLVGMLGNTLSNSANVLVASAYGNEVGEMFGSVLGGAASGAAMGMLAGPVGAAIGAVAGGVAGAIQGATNNFQKKDDAFKSVVQSEYDRVTENEKNMLQNGTAVYAAREMTQTSFETLIGKEATNNLIPQLKTYADVTPFAYDTIMNSANQLLAFSVKPDKMMGLMKMFGDLSGGNADKLATIIRSYGKSFGAGRADMQDLNMMTEAGIPILSSLAKVKKVSEKQIKEVISKGKVSASDVEKAIELLTTNGGMFEGMMDKMSTTYSGLLSTKEGLDDDLDAAYGQGYAERRKEGLQKSIDFGSSETFGILKQGYEKIGEYKAMLENDQDEKLRQSFERVIESEAYKIAENEGNTREMGRMLKEAEVQAQIDYYNSTGYQLFQQTEINMVNNLQNSLSSSWHNFGYQMGLEFNKGLASTEAGRQITLQGKGGASNPAPPLLKPNAWGLSFVPYDGYPAILHEGERVMTASENRQYSSGGGSSASITITGNTFSVRNDSDIDAIASALADKIEEAREGYYSG